MYKISYLMKKQTYCRNINNKNTITCTIKLPSLVLLEILLNLINTEPREVTLLLLLLLNKGSNRKQGTHNPKVILIN